METSEAFGSNDTQRGRPINLEFVSANPTGPLHIGHARWAALGDSIGRLLLASGATLVREFYINDAGAQMERFGRSLLAAAKGDPTPEDGYPGTYITDLALRVIAAHPDLLELPVEAQLTTARDRAYDLQLSDLRSSLAKIQCALRHVVLGARVARKTRERRSKPRGQGRRPAARKGPRVLLGGRGMGTHNRLR